MQYLLSSTTWVRVPSKDPESINLIGKHDPLMLWLGNEIYKHATGKQSIHSSDENHLKEDFLCWIASMTKIVTAVAVMQLVERGIVSLEDNIREIVPELRDIQILECTKEGIVFSLYI